MSDKKRISVWDAMRKHQEETGLKKLLVPKNLLGIECEKEKKEKERGKSE